MGVFQALCAVCINVGFCCFRLGVASWARDIGAYDLAAAIAVGTFEPRQEALGAWQGVRGEAMSG